MKRDKPKIEAVNYPKNAAPVPIVGLGASAGGLEALESFFGNVPSDCGLAFVVVQHLDPTYKGIMVELLQRSTQMNVSEVRDGEKILPGHVYVIPPNKDMSVLHDTLHLFDFATPRGQRLPIDFFLRSLAEDRRDLAIGVILSGMGSDGTLGLRAIKEMAGLALVQEPESAKFEGMPQSAIDAGLADMVAPVEALPGLLIDFLERTKPLASTRALLEKKSQSEMEKAIILLRARSGNDFSLYKRSTIYRRIERRIAVHKINGIADYVRFLQENREELDLLFKELLIGVTSFFRDPPAWDALRDSVLIPMVKSERDGVIRAWVPGCSTGEEAYSLAIVFKEILEMLKPISGVSMQIFATDLDNDAIEVARRAFYPTNIAADISADRLRRFFLKEDDGYRINKEIREMVIFAQQNLIMDPPFTKLEIICCRNLLIYFSPELQKKIIPLFHYSIKSDGVLFLGSAETVGVFKELFAPLDSKARIFKRLDAISAKSQLEFPSSFKVFPGACADAVITGGSGLSIQSSMEKLLLERFTPAAVLVNEEGDIIHISGKTGKYLEPAAGKANWNLLAMAREGLRYELSSAFQRVQCLKEPVLVSGVAIKDGDETRYINLDLQHVENPDSLSGLILIVFIDAPPPPSVLGPKYPENGGRDSVVESLEKDLRRAREELQSLSEEMQTSQEELKSGNEELQSTNEELQSTNEELTTSKEEMQSMNEELQTVNSELQAKVEELSQTNDDMKNLFNSTNIATLFLDMNLRVRRFTTPTTKIIKLIASDVNRPITDLASELLYPELASDAEEVLRTLVFSEKQVASKTGGWFAVRIMPYRTLGNKIDGIVITFSDISAMKKLETELQELTGGRADS